MRSFCHETPWIHWVAKPCTTTAYRWVFRDSPPSLRTLWSAVVNSPKFSARGTASPVRLLVILVLLQISQIRSFGMWVLVLCFLATTFVGRSESESWEVFAGVSLHAGTSLSLRFSVNSSNHSGLSRNQFLLYQYVVSVLDCVFVFVRLRDRFLDAWTFVSSLRCAAGLEGFSPDVSCGNDVEDELALELEEPVANPGGTDVFAIFG